MGGVSLSGHWKMICPRGCSEREKESQEQRSGEHVKIVEQPLVHLLGVQAEFMGKQEL